MVANCCRADFGVWDGRTTEEGWGADICELRGEGGRVLGAERGGRTVGGRVSAREGRAAANCWRADFGVRGENSSELLEGGLRTRPSSRVATSTPRGDVLRKSQR